MSRNRRTSTRRPPPRPSRAGRPAASRAQLAFAIISSLVICAMIGTAFVTLSFDDVFGDLFDDDADSENLADPNSDIIAAQETIVAQNPDDLEELLLLANLYGNTGRTGDAITTYEKALQIAPDDVGARISFARVLADNGMEADARLQFDRALELDPDNQQAHYYLAELYMAERPPNTEEAVPHYQRALAIDPGTLIGERSQTRLDTLGASAVAASPVASPAMLPAASPEMD